MMASDKIDLRNLDKSDWPTYRFDEIAQHISERVDPNNTDLKTYIGLEHIDPESLHIRRFGTPDDVNGTKLKFYKGDIIFGRRRAYQRKAGIATMDGFCSAHALVLRANPEVIDPQLFPFFIQSDLFMHRAVDISVGSLSPTINWKILKEQSFKLPPKWAQKEVVPLFHSIQKLKESYSFLKLEFEKYRTAYISSLPSQCETEAKISETDIIIIDGDRGKNYPKSKDFIGEDEGFCVFLNAKNVTKTGLDLTSLQFISEEKDALLRKGKLERNDIVLTTRGTVGNFAYYSEAIPFNHVRINSGMVILRNTSNKIDTKMLYKLFKLGYFDREIEKRAYGSAQPQLSVKIIQELKLPFFEARQAQIIARTIKKLETLELTIEDSKNRMGDLSKSFSLAVFNQ